MGLISITVTPETGIERVMVNCPYCRKISIHEFTIESDDPDEQTVRDAYHEGNVICSEECALKYYPEQIQLLRAMNDPFADLIATERETFMDKVVRNRIIE